MRIIDDRTGQAGETVSTAEEALLALSARTDERLARGLRHVWDFVHPDDAVVDSDDEPERRTLQAVAEQRPGVLAAALSPPGGRAVGHLRAWSPWNPQFDPFNETNVLAWPRTVSELRGDAVLAEATLGELAAHLNAGLRGDLAALLRDCADFVRADDGFEPRDETQRTVWDHFRYHSDLYELDLAAVAAAIASGPPAWETLDDWTPTGGIDDDPYTVCRYVWGPLGARVHLSAAELLQRYLAGDATLTLYRVVLDYGEGPTEFIWPDQTYVCCGFKCGWDGTLPPLGVNYWGRPHVDVYARGRCCRICGRGRYAGLLTKRQLDSDETATLGVSEPLDELPPATLTAIAHHGADAVACELRR
ncbi:MAG: hypothetical protein F4121_11930 [Acidimicrobiia bacterium]|nr:hypothetical protein [Acidimicrobiia bacterium]MYC46375.1 hypothetical protein [Acidimicrobiia bacterium]MYI20748.1 hypothetical protein [Acidimicrobiia bacterium]